MDLTFAFENLRCKQPRFRGGPFKAFKKSYTRPPHTEINPLEVLWVVGGRHKIYWAKIKLGDVAGVVKLVFPRELFRYWRIFSNASDNII